MRLPVLNFQIRVPLFPFSAYMYVSSEPKRTSGIESLFISMTVGEDTIPPPVLNFHGIFPFSVSKTYMFPSKDPIIISSLPSPSTSSIAGDEST